MTTHTVNRREFLKYLAGGIAAAKLAGCSPSGSDSGSASAPGIASEFDVLDTKVDGLAYGQNGVPPLSTGRHLSAIKFYAKKNMTGITVGQKLINPAGKVDWELNSPQFDVVSGTVYQMPAFDVPLKNGPTGSYTLEHKITNADGTDTLRTLNPQLVANSATPISTYKVSEAIDFLKRLYQGNANPGVVGIVGDSAPASDVVATSEIANRFIADAKAKYGHSAPILESKLVSEMPVLTGKSGFVVGKGANNARAQDLITALGASIATDTGYLQTAELPTGELYILVSGTPDDLRVRQAARALATYDTPAYNINGNKLKVTGTNLTDIVVVPG